MRRLSLTDRGASRFATQLAKADWDGTVAPSDGRRDSLAFIDMRSREQRPVEDSTAHLVRFLTAHSKLVTVELNERNKDCVVSFDLGIHTDRHVPW